MSGAARHAGDALGIGVGIWFLIAPEFADLPAKRLFDAIAIGVVGLSAWRIVQRLRGRGR
jgi:hypothetical protein